MEENEKPDSMELVLHELKEVVPAANAFRVVPQSNVHLANHIRHFYINMAHNILEIVIEETKEFTVLNWVAGLANEELKNEVLTFMNLDPKNNILCMIRFSQLSLLDHETTFDHNTPTRVRHEVHLKFEMMERVNEVPLIGG